MKDFSREERINIWVLGLTCIALTLGGASLGRGCTRHDGEIKIIPIPTEKTKKKQAGADPDKPQDKPRSGAKPKTRETGSTKASSKKGNATQTEAVFHPLEPVETTTHPNVSPEPTHEPGE